MFILGSNWKLSLAELDNCLKYSKNKGKIVDYSANIVVVEFESLHEDRYYVNNLMEFQYLLGGCQKIAKIYDFVYIRDAKEAFPLKIEKFKQVERARKKIIQVLSNVLEEIFPRIKNESLFFAVSIYPNLFDDEYYSSIMVKHVLPFLNKKIIEILNQKGCKKSSYYKYPEKNIQTGKLNPIFPHHLIKYGLLNKDRAEIVFGYTEEGFYIARTFTTDDPSFKKRIDEDRPFKEFKSAISPKLALIMFNFLNLFEMRDKKRILDPFVGNGTIPLLAIVQDFQVYGSDIDDKKVSNTIRNVSWLLEDLEEPIPLLINQHFKATDIKDLSKHFESNSIDGICSEPPLGPYYRDKPYYIQAKELIKSELEPLYNIFFVEAYKVLKQNARICITAPIISTIDGGDIQINIKKIADNNNFKSIPMLDFKRIINKSNQKLQFRKQHVISLVDAKKNQIVKRKLYVFEKQDK